MPPPSRARWIDPFLFAATAVAAYVVCRRLPLTTTGLAIVLVAAVTTVMCALELRDAAWAKLRRPTVTFDEATRRAVVPWLGTVAGIALVVVAWALVPESRRGFYRPFYDVGRGVLPFAPLVTAVFLVLTEWRLGPADDDGRHLGLLLAGRAREADWRRVRDALIGWFIKGFFFPITFSELVHKIDSFRGSEAWTLSLPWPMAVDRIDTMLFAALLVAIAPGYLFSARLFGNELKKVDATWLGWAVTLLCYPPFNAAPPSYAYPLDASGRLPWAVWSNGHAFAAAIGVLLIALELVHFWGEATFGLRSSNLSNRGILTNGPYRFCKHPVYLVKCVAWLLLWAPLQDGWTIPQRIGWVVTFAMWCGLYLARSWAEEKMLSDDASYVAYGRWIDAHGALRFLGRAAPFFRYEWRLQRWIAQGAIRNVSCARPQETLHSDRPPLPSG